MGEQKFMLWFLAALGTSFCFGASNTLFKLGTTRALSSVKVQFFYYTMAFCVVLFYGIFHKELHLTFLSLSIGGLVGVLNANGNLQMVKAFEKGPASITTTIIAMNSLVGILATAFFFPESLPLWQWFGIALLICSTAIVQHQPEKKNHLEHKSWLLHCTLSLLSIGLASFFLKIASVEKIDFINTLVPMFGGGWCFFSVLSYRELAHKGFRTKMEIQIGAIVGLIMATGYGLYIYSLKTGPAGIVFSIISLNALVVVIAGVVFFEERLKAYQVAGVILALAGIVLTKV
jgi:drug/metabolite transporter (DMT)-like permease